MHRHFRVAGLERSRPQQLLQLIELLAKCRFVAGMLELDQQEPQADDPRRSLADRPSSVSPEGGQLLGVLQHGGFRLHRKQQLLVIGFGGQDPLGRLEDRRADLGQRLGVAAAACFISP